MILFKKIKLKKIKVKQNFFLKYIVILVLGVIDRVGRPDPRSRPKSVRDPDFSGVATRALGRDPKLVGHDRSSVAKMIATRSPNKNKFFQIILIFYLSRVKVKFFWRKSLSLLRRETQYMF